MKIIKLLALAAVIGGLLWAISQIPRLIDFGDSNKVTRDSISAPLKDFNDKYMSEWNDCNEWDPVLYKAHIAGADYLVTVDKIDEETYEKLKININNHVLERIVTLLEADYKKPEIPEKKVRINLSGIDTLAKYIPNEPNISKMKGAWQAYNNIREFVNKEYSAGAFPTNLHGSSWNAFDSHKSRITSQIDGHKNNTYYKEYFKDNKILNSGLAAVPDKVEKCRTSYNQNLLRQIKSAYGRVPTFDKERYFAKMRMANTGSQWDQAKREFDAAWDNHMKEIREKKRTLGAINTEFKNQVGGSMAKELENFYADYPSTQKKPDAPSKPNFER